MGLAVRLRSTLERFGLVSTRRPRAIQTLLWAKVLYVGLPAHKAAPFIWSGASTSQRRSVL